MLGNYHGISSKQVTPVEGIQRQFTTAQVQYAQGATYTASTPSLVPSTVLTPPDGSHGVQVEYFDNPELQGQPKLRRTEPRVLWKPRRLRRKRFEQLIAEGYAMSDPWLDIDSTRFE